MVLDSLAHPFLPRTPSTLVSQPLCTVVLIPAALCYHSELADLSHWHLSLIALSPASPRCCRAVAVQALSCWCLATCGQDFCRQHQTLRLRALPCCCGRRPSQVLLRWPRTSHIQDFPHPLAPVCASASLSLPPVRAVQGSRCLCRTPPTSTAQPPSDHSSVQARPYLPLISQRRDHLRF